MKTITRTLATFATIGGMACAAPARAADDVVIVYDASGSMWGQIDGTSKLEIAREVMADLVNEWDEGANLGLVAYGHRRKGDCTDIETLIAPGPVYRGGFIETVNAIRPVGKTPLTAAVRQAAELLSYRDHPATVVLISDGVETCNADPCALSAELERQGVDFTAHVVGFDLQDETHAALSCIAENTGGLFVPAGSADELHEALAQVKSAVEQQPVAEPEPEPEPALPEMELAGPAQVTTGAVFDVSWSDPVDARDMVGIVAMGADEGTRGSYLRVGGDTEGKLTAPAEPGLYELRYILNEGGKTLATAMIEVVETQVEVTGPATATTGAAVAVSWSDPVNPRDMVGIVAMGADEGTRGSYLRVGGDTEGKLTAPAEPGLYELRYILNEGGKTLATATIEVVTAEIGISGPGTVRAGTDVDISWSSTVNPRDMVGIVAMGADEGTRGSYLRIGDKTDGRLKAPTEPGLYEIRYILNEGGKTLASASLEVVAEDAPLDTGAGLSAPATAQPGETITVTWTGGSDSDDQRISLARKDQAVFGWIAVFPIGDETSMNVAMPEQPGLYEIRFLDVSNQDVLGRAVVEVK
ncbi:VWA domain-containing protein [Maritimibacter fusiformis]|uniref:VWA domain-containing protein n=1 Tax=Maritimibacter fusiformis TaxID=2603819 RepID=A0A5D0RP39_9RHOB|nr:VWA domain-containing protein [Maritimibacter fusiformis]TYB83350.1 VWA domain-containing protein [Maritimibacter fusiformis]